MRDPDRFYRLLPSLYREQDQSPAGRGALRAILSVMGEQADVLEADVRQLRDDFFIETCRRWLVPYIGDLVGNNLLHEASSDDDLARELLPELIGPDLRPEPVTRTRADVAKTIYYRRRKGTLPMLEELAHDVTGWAAHAVEFFELLDWSQNLNHLRPHCHECIDVRSVERVDRVHGPFDDASHAVDVRHIAQQEGWHNIRNIGFFLWRLRAYPMGDVAARQAGQVWQYHFSPLGSAAPLFARQQREGDEAGLATERHVPGPIRPAAFFDDLVRHQATPSPRPDFTDYYGLFTTRPGSGMATAARSFAVVVDGVPVPPDRVRCKDLETWQQPSDPNFVAVDVRRGRIAFGTNVVPGVGVDVDYHYGFAANLGGGPYARAKWMFKPGPAGVVRLSVSQRAAGQIVPGADLPAFPDLAAALAEWAAQNKPNTIITLLDNRTYELPAQIALFKDRWLVIQADDHRRPHLRATATANNELLITGDDSGTELTLSGLLIEGGVRVAGVLERLRLLHCTLVPGRTLTEDGVFGTTDPSLLVEGSSGGNLINSNLRIIVAFSMCGPVRLPPHADGVWVLDSIVDGLDGGLAFAATDPAADEFGPPATFVRSTVLGSVMARRLPLASESIFSAPVTAERIDEGCVRFSFLPDGSSTPRRYRCQPELEIATRAQALQEAGEGLGAGGALTAAQLQAVTDFVRGWLVPGFTSTRYGEPGYGQLLLASPRQISTGAQDASEMGAFCHLKQNQRATNLRIRLDEYLPFGLDAGLIYVT